MYKSETSKCRDRLSKYCIGNGLDIGYGGDAIIPSAITIDLDANDLKVGNAPLNLKGCADNLYWFKDGVLDYIYSSHLLEDFSNTKEVLKEWLRTLKVGGMLVLFCPVERIYRKYCEDNNQPYNVDHKIVNFSLEYLSLVLDSIGVTQVIHSVDLIEEYSFELVVQKIQDKEDEG
jgi:predicted SAM-dependent methyltransferase